MRLVKGWFNLRLVWELSNSRFTWLNH